MENYLCKRLFERGDLQGSLCSSKFSCNPKRSTFRSFNKLTGCFHLQFFPQASDSSLYARHVYRALFSRNNILTGLNNNNPLLTNANNQPGESDRIGDEERSRLDRTPSPVPGKQFRQAKKLFSQDSDASSAESRSRLRSQSTAGFKAANLAASTASSNSTPGLLSKRRAQSLAKQTLDVNYLDAKSSNGNLSAIPDEAEYYFDYPLRRSSRNASLHSLNLSCRDSVPEKISFVEYAISLSALLKGSVEEKLAWTFQLYDTTGDGMS